MARHLLLAVVPFFLGCAKDHHIPPAELGYLGLSRQSTNLYQVSFTADADLLNIFKPEDSPVGGLLRCSLVGDDMPNEHSSERYVAKGLVSSLAAGPTISTFLFHSSIMFVENLNGGAVERGVWHGCQTRSDGPGMALRDDPRNSAGARGVSRSETRMPGALSLWLLSLSREQRESDSP
ncbi:hypothetical protein ACUTAF_15120 [Pseudomonas sp. SP16.1]|uniref:hypothetical protein n=1 Tax=Pseudomonas sp. SP16.1 TaxID=3458854 RepID=UPI0040462D19